MRRGHLVPALLFLGLVAGCAADDHKRGSQVRQPIVPPEQQSSSIAAIRLRFGNPPHFDLVTLRDDGSHLRVIVAAPAGALQRLESPAWSPDARRIYFSGALAERHGRDAVYYESDAFVVDSNGGEPRRLTFSRDVGTPAPSPDGKTLLVRRMEHPGEAPFTSGMWLMDADGKNARRLLDTEDGQIDWPGSWSPDGRTIAFTRCRFAYPNARGRTENTCAVYVVAPDGSGLRKLADHSSEPAFSPDGQHISYVSDRDEHGIHQTGSDEEDFANELYVMDIDGADQRRLTETESLDEATPSWSPDADRIVFAREGPASFVSQLMLVNGRGSCSSVVVGYVARPSVYTSFESPAWRPGRLVGKRPPVTCG